MRVRSTRVDSTPMLSVVIGNLAPIAGVLGLGWSPSALLLVYQAELAAICLYTLLKIPFAHKRPNNAIDDRFALAGPLQAKRGSIALPGPLPPVYPRNLPTLAVAIGLTPVVIGAAFVAFALTRPTVTEATAAAFLLGGAVVVLTRGLEAWSTYFRDGGYREHSPRTLLFVPFRYLFVVTTLAVGLIGLEATVGVHSLLDPERSVLVLAVGKLAYDVRVVRRDREAADRSLFARLYGSPATEIVPEPVETPDRAPALRVSMDRRARVVDAVGHGLAYLVGWVGGLLGLVVGLGLLAGRSGIVLAGLGIGGGVVALRAGVRYLRYGTLEYRCYGDVLVAYDRVLEEPQATVRPEAVTGVHCSKGGLDRLLGTTTLEFDVPTTSEPSVRPFVPDPETIDISDDANESVGMTLPHLRAPQQVTDVLGVTEADSNAA